MSTDSKETEFIYNFFYRAIIKKYVSQWKVWQLFESRKMMSVTILKYILINFHLDKQFTNSVSLFIVVNII